MPPQDARLSPWLTALWLALCLGAFLLSLHVRSQDWSTALRGSGARPVSSTVLPL
jgi:hypothetical protein